MSLWNPTIASLSRNSVHTLQIDCTIVNIIATIEERENRKRELWPSLTTGRDKLVMRTSEEVGIISFSLLTISVSSLLFIMTIFLLPMYVLIYNCNYHTKYIQTYQTATCPPNDWDVVVPNVRLIQALHIFNVG